MLLGPRAAVLVWWLVNPVRVNAAFNTFILPLLGLLILPWTTLMYLIVWSPVTGLVAWDWLWLGLALLVDIGSLGGGAYGNRERIPGYRG
jgi:hypothetical protein